MFRTMAGRTTRAFAAGALILSLTATTFAGSANAAPLADDKTDCSTAAHARNDAVHLLHDAWKAFNGDLKTLASDARKLQHESEKASAVATKDARHLIASAKAELRDIVSQAHSDIQAAVDLGSACSDDTDSTIPEPATVFLMSSGLAAGFLLRQRRASSRNKAALAARSSRAAVLGDISRASAISSTDKPPKYCISTARAFRSSKRSRAHRASSTSTTSGGSGAAARSPIS